MKIVRLAAISLVAALVLYYARFFVLMRQDLSTAVQIALLVVAAAVVLAPAKAAAAMRAPNVWSIVLVAVGASAAIVVWADQESHSATR